MTLNHKGVHSMYAEIEREIDMTFRGKRWKRDCNHYLLVGTNIAVYQWNSGEKANFLVEERGKGRHTVHGKGAAARDAAIALAFSLAGLSVED